MNASTLKLISSVFLALVTSGLCVHLIQKFKGITYINVAKAIVSSIKNALDNAGMASNQLNNIFNIILESITYVQVICSDDSIDTKTNTAFNYIKPVCAQLNIKLTDHDLAIITDALKIGFILMQAFNITNSVSYRKLAKYARIKNEDKLTGLSRIQTAKYLYFLNR